MNYFTKNNDISCESGGISIPKRSAIAIAIAIVMGIAGLSLVGCPDNTGSGDGTGSDTTAPAQITGLAQMRSADLTSVTLSWTNPADTDLETIRITVTPSLSGFPLDVEANGASMSQSEVVTGLTAGEDYTFAVLTIDTAGNESASSGAPTVIASSDTTAPGRVTGAASSVSTDSITLSWTNPTDADLSHISITWTPDTSGPMQPIETARTTPVATTQLITGLTASTAYIFTLVAVDTSGNRSALLGAPMITDTTVAEFTAIGAGGAHTCALRGGEVSCWGFRSSGRVGDGGAVTGSQVTPVAVSLADVSAIAVGGSHTCAVAGATDAAYCWGRGNDGRLGNGATSGDQSSPVAVLSGESGIETNLTGVSTISVGVEHTCAIAGNDDAAYCWGRGNDGRLGNGATSGDQSSPVAVLSGESGIETNLTGVSTISVGNSHTCAIAGATNAAYCWGRGDNGQLGNGATSGEQAAPVAVMGPLGTTALTGVTAIAAGVQNTCAIANGTAYCWGEGRNGRLGSNTTDDQSRPVLVVATNEIGALPTSGADGRTSLAAVTSINADRDANGSSPRTCAVAGSTNIAYCWGRGGDALGIGASATDQIRPAAVQGVGGSGMPNGMLSGIVAISAGAVHTCAISPTAAYCWGGDINGQLGNGATVTASQSSPVDITGFF